MLRALREGTKAAPTCSSAAKMQRGIQLRFSSMLGQEEPEVEVALV
jgi:hypothetical protein